MAIHPGLREALDNPLWKSHNVGDRYDMDGDEDWDLWYYPMFECGKTMEPFGEPRALVGKPKMFGKKQGIDFREVPLRYLRRQQ